MRSTVLLFLTISFAAILNLSGNAQVSDSQPISHSKWDALVKRFVDNAGNVDYEGFKNVSDELQVYLDLLSSHHPNEKNWSREERLAYWINAYNAFTVKLVVDNYPVESIKDIKKGLPMINSVWDIKFINIEGHEYDLNHIEHGILRKEFDEPRIHFAINCASVSCPVLRAEAYTAEKIEAQLQDQTEIFLADPSRNVISRNSMELSKIFDWFKGDFTKAGTLADFIDRYTEIDISEKASVSYLEYDWKLNDQ